MMLMRTAKSCGPDAPTLASSFAGFVPRDDGGKRARSPGRARNKPLNHCAGKAGCSGEPVVTNARAFYNTRAAAGATGTRLSLRPLIFWRDGFAQLGRIARRDREIVVV